MILKVGQSGHHPKMMPSLMNDLLLLVANFIVVYTYSMHPPSKAIKIKLDGQSLILFPPWPWFAQIFLCFDRSSQISEGSLLPPKNVDFHTPFDFHSVQGLTPLLFCTGSLLARIAFVSGGRALLCIFMSFILQNQIQQPKVVTGGHQAKVATLSLMDFQSLIVSLLPPATPQCFNVPQTIFSQ